MEKFFAILSIDVKVTSGKTHVLFTIKSPRILGIKWNFFNLINYKTVQQNIINHLKQQTFPLRTMRQACSLPPFLFNNGLKVCDSTVSAVRPAMKKNLSIEIE